MSAPELKKKSIKNLNKIKIPHAAWETEKKIAYLEEGEKACFEVSDQIQDVKTGLFEEDEHVEIYNTEGYMYQDDRVRTRITILAIATDGKQFQVSFKGPGLSKGLELLEETDLVSIAKETAHEAVEMLTAPEGPSGEMQIGRAHV